MRELIVEFNGQTLDEDDLTLLLEVRVQQKLSLPALCEFAFLIGPNSQLPARMPLGGKAVVRVATRQSSGVLFEGEITAREYVYNPDEGPQLRVRAYDQLHRLRKHQQVRSYVNVSLRELAGQLLRDSGVQAAPTTASGVPAVKWQRLIQSGQTHFDFLREQCTDVGVFFTLRGDRFYLLTLQGMGTPRPLTLGGSLLEASFEVNGNQTSRRCKAATWNPRRAEAQTGTAAKPRVGRRVPAEAGPERVGGAAEFQLPGGPAENERLAAALAQAELDFRAAGEVTLRGVAAGNPGLRPGARVRIDEVAPEVAGEYVLTEVTHVMTGDQGYTAEISSEPARPAPRPRATIAVLGRVSNVDDPDGLGRVQVTLPAYEDAETDWMQVVVPGAGKNKGVIALPNVGDSVLVLCAQENPVYGVVLGGLFGTQPPPDAGVAGGKTQRFGVHTPGGHHVLLDDHKNVLRITGSRGSYVELAPAGVLLHAAGKLEIKAPGKPVTIQGASIDFKTG